MWIKNGIPWNGKPLWGADGYWIFKPTPEQFRAAGYEWKEPPAPPAPEPLPKRYSKLKIIRVLGDAWETYKAQIEAAGLLDEFAYAEYLAEDDPVFAAFLESVPDEVKAKLDQCLWE